MMNTKYDIKFLESRWASHFSPNEKLLLQERFSHQREYYLSLKKKKLFSPPPQINLINYHKALNVGDGKLILIVGGEGKSTYLNSKTFNLYPGANANITGDISNTKFKNDIDASFKAIDECYRILKPGGRLVIVTGVKYEKIIKDILQTDDNWQMGPKLEISESNFPIDKFASEKRKAPRKYFSVTPIHFFKM